MKNVLVNVAIVVVFAAAGHLRRKAVSVGHVESPVRILNRCFRLYGPILTGFVLLAAVGVYMDIVYGVAFSLRHTIRTKFYHEGVMVLLAAAGYFTGAVVPPQLKDRNWFSALVALVPVIVLLAIHRTPLPDGQLELSSRAVRGELVVQTTGASCAAASGANVMQAFGELKSEKEMGELFGTTESGTAKDQIIRGFEQLGFNCRRVYISDRDPRKLNPPAMLFVKLYPGGGTIHTIAMISKGTNTVEIWDPMGFKGQRDPSELKDIWPGSAIEITR